MDGCKVQVLQLEVSNDHQGSDKIDLGMHFHHRTLITLAGTSRRQQLTWRRGVKRKQDMHAAQSATENLNQRWKAVCGRIKPG